MHQVVVVGQHLGTRCEFVQAGIPTNGVFHIVAERTGVHPIERRRLMQPDKWISVVPVSTGSALPVNNREGCFGHFVEDGVGKRHTHGSSADDQVVRVHAPVSRSAITDDWVKTLHRCHWWELHLN